MWKERESVDYTYIWEMNSVRSADLLWREYLAGPDSAVKFDINGTIVLLM